ASCTLNLVLIAIASYLYLIREGLPRHLARTFRSSIICKPYASTSPFFPKATKDDTLNSMQRDEPRLTHLVMPHHPTQKTRLIENMNSWIEYQPCNIG